MECYCLDDDDDDYGCERLEHAARGAFHLRVLLPLEIMLDEQLWM